jgi:hypothetical protein
MSEIENPLESSEKFSENKNQKTETLSSFFNDKKQIKKIILSTEVPQKLEGIKTLAVNIY